MSIHRKKKPVEFHFVDMNDPGRYKKLKVARACDFCRRRKSKCDIGIPGSGTCSNCHKHQVVCVFSPVPVRGSESARPEETPTTPREFFDYFHFKYPLLYIYNAQAGYEKNPFTPTSSSSSTSSSSTNYYSSNLDLSITYPPPSPIDYHHHQQQKHYHYNHAPEISSQLEFQLLDIYFEYIHPAYPILLKQSILNIFTQDRHMLNKGLRYAILSTATHFYSFTSFYLEKNSTSFDFDLALLSTGNHVLYEAAQRELNLDCPKLETVQTLLLLYKYDDISGRFVQNTYYLEICMRLLGKLQSTLPQQEEMINRARWVLFISIGLSNLTDKRFSQLYTQLDLPIELPQSLDEEKEPSHRQHMNQFAQIANLSVLYSHTVQSLITGANSNLICIKQFREIRQHWNDSLHPSTLQKLTTEEKPMNIKSSKSNENSESNDDTTSTIMDEEKNKHVDILIIYNAILYDMLYLILLLHHKLEIEGVEIADRLLIMINSWINRPNFSSTISSHRMAAFGLAMCLQIHLKAIRNPNYFSNKSITTIVQEIRCAMKQVQRDPRVDKELAALYDQLVTSPLPLQYQQPPQDYFSIIPLQLDSTSSSPLEHSLSTPGLWDIVSTGDITTPITEEEQVALSNITTASIEVSMSSSVIGSVTAGYENMLKWMREQQINDPITPSIAPTTMTDTNLAADYFNLTLESCCYSEDSNPADPKSQVI